MFPYKLYICKNITYFFNMELNFNVYRKKKEFHLNYNILLIIIISIIAMLIIFAYMMFLKNMILR